MLKQQLSYLKDLVRNIKSSMHTCKTCLTYPHHRLKSFSDSLESYIRGLESLGRCQESYGSLLIPLILNKLPSFVRHNITRDHGNDDWDISTLRKALKKEICIQEAAQSNPTDTEVIPTASFLTKTTNKRWKSVGFKEAKDSSKPVNKRSCLFCQESHHSNDCTKVTDQNARHRIVKEKRVCFNCFGNHKVSDCMSKYKCRYCGKKHHSSICNDRSQNKSVVLNEETHVSDDASKTNDTTNTSVMHSSVSAHTEILLKTAIAPVWHNDQSMTTNILLDEGAQNSFITHELAEKLQIQPSGKVTMQISAFGGNEGEVRNLDKATISIETESKVRIPMSVIIVPKIATLIHMKEYAQVTNLPYLKGLKLAHPVSNDDKFNISLLIGADYYWSIVQDEIIRGKGPTAVKSKIGYLLSGPIKTSVNTTCTKQWNSTMMNVLVGHKTEELNLQKFWEIESCGTEDSDENEKSVKFMSDYQNSCINFEDGRYIAKLPWKTDHPELTTNESVARRRTQNVVNRLNKDPEMLQHYSKIIKEQEMKGFIEKVPTDEIESKGKTLYIPHHPVKKESSTTPIRIVYDCSCRENAELPSLNDCLSSEPPILNKLTDIITRFRFGKYGITTDIEKAFLQVGLDKEDRDVTRFFWLSDPANPESELTIYRFKVVLFGATCSPFILSATLLKHISMHPCEASTILKRDLYVDNVLTSTNSEDEATSYFKMSRKLLQEGGFNLRSWMSNSTTLKNLANSENVLDSDKETKILGLRWNTESDTLSFATKQLQMENLQVTKREILRQSSAIYDPLGLLGPVTIKAKILMQELWKKGYAWDELLPTEIVENWKTVKSDIMCAMKELEIPRYYFGKENTDNSDRILHIFVDASQKAYGASVYITQGEQSTLVIAKNRVAPLKAITLPKLELMAAVIGTRLAKDLIPNLEIRKAVFWSDSQIVLHWLTTSIPLNKFVTRRVNEIKDITKNYEWKYVSTDMNPADLQTRGITAEQFEHSTLWMHGPKWITDETKWPIWNGHLSKTTLLTSVENENFETEEQIVNNSQHGISQLIDVSRFSTLGKLLSVTAYVIKFVNNCKRKLAYRLRNRNRVIQLSTEEIALATSLWIKDTQMENFSQERECISKKLNKRTPTLVKQLSLFLDENDIVRCKGRLQNSPLDEDAKFPILLPKNNKFTDLVIMGTHVRALHSGVGQTITSVRQSYWIPSIRHCVRTVLRKCVQCQKLLNRPYARPDPPPLPKDRVKDIQPFATTGIDFAGPLHIKDGSTTRKVYICLFTCACIRAVHLELVSDLTLDSFLLAFRRFISRKATPQTVYSDNAQTFVAAPNEIRRLSLYINWKFIPKGAPWYGGWWERLIGITKMTLKKVLGRSVINEHVLRTIITEIETVINNRPLTYISSDVRDPEPLTPSHLLHGRIISTMNNNEQNTDTQQLDESSANRLLHRKKLLMEHFSKRWHTEYLTGLREYHRAAGRNDGHVKIGDIVQIESDTQRVVWKLGIIEDIIVGRDGLTRAAKVRTSRGLVTTRPIVKLYPLEL